jgi:hypothetical protein
MSPVETAITNYRNTWRYCDILWIGRKRTDLITSFLKKNFEMLLSDDYGKMNFKKAVLVGALKGGLRI